MILSAIVARARNGVIGRENRLPWHFSEDLKFFREKTKGHILIMGRKTFESLGKALPTRFHIVISRNSNLTSDNPMVKYVQDVPTALQLARATLATAKPAVFPEEVFVIGGSEIFALLLPQVERVYLTEIDADYEGNTYFPSLPKEAWRLVDQRDLGQEPKLSFQTWEARERSPSL